jgi:hypothetical protein
VHQGNGTASIFENENRVFTFSMHGEHNYPLHKERSDLDVGLPDGIEDSAYLKLLDFHLKNTIDMVQPDFIFYQCGVDILKTNGKAKTRKELCIDIVNSYKNKTGSPNLPTEAPVQVITPIVLPSVTITSVTAPEYTEEVLNKKLKPEVLEIASNLGIERYKKANGKIKNARDTKNAIINAILDFLQSSKSIIQPVTQPIIETVQPLNILTEQYTEETLKKESKKELLSIASNLNIKTYQNKAIKSHNKPEIIKAILEKLSKPASPKAASSKPSSPKAASSKPSSPKAASSKPSSPKAASSKPASIETLIENKRKELLALLKFKECKECDIEKDEYCDDEICDLTKKPNLCISKEEAEYKREHSKKSTFKYVLGDKEYLGHEPEIRKIEDIVYKKTGGFGEYKEDIKYSPIAKPITKKKLCKTCEFSNESTSFECIICNSKLLTDKDINGIYPTSGTEIFESTDPFNIPGDTEIIESDNIEDILNKIQKNDNITLDSLHGLDEAKKKVLSCLGLLG